MKIGSKKNSTLSLGLIDIRKNRNCFQRVDIKKNLTATKMYLLRFIKTRVPQSRVERNIVEHFPKHHSWENFLLMVYENSEAESSKKVLIFARKSEMKLFTKHFLNSVFSISIWGKSGSRVLCMRNPSGLFRHRNSISFHSSAPFHT